MKKPTYLFLYIIIFGLMTTGVQPLTASASNDSLSIINPAYGSTVSGIATIQVSSSDVSTNPNIQISIDGGAYQTMSFDGSEWAYSWDTARYANASHIITVRAMDGGNVNYQTIYVIANNGMR